MTTSKIIRGVINATKYTVTAPVVKEDYGLYLQIEGADLPETYEVDFSNEEMGGTSVTMIGNADGVHIPNQFIKSGRDIFAFLFLVSEDFGRTVYKFRIPNKLRPDRTDAQPDPEEQSVIDQAIAALNDAVEQTAADVVTTTAKASEASAAAETATQKALEAAASATAAGQSALDAKSYRDSAGLSAENASMYAGFASESATSASASAGTATTKASEAAQSATDASTAKDVAVTAKVAAETAQAASETAAAMLENILPTDTASGAVASFPDGTDLFPAKSVVVGIDPVQDLHGYDSPWPAGGGKNLIDYLSCVGVGARNGTDSVYGNNTSISGSELTITQAYGGNGGILKGVGTFPLVTGEYVTISGKATLTGTSTLVVGISNYDGGGTNNINTVVAVVNGKFSVTLDAKSDYAKTGIFLQPTTVNSTAVVSDIMVALGQTELSYAPYSNICPITGWTGANVRRTGKNLLPIQTLTRQGSTYYVGDSDTWFFFKAGTYTASNVGTASYMYWRKKGTSNNNIIHNGSKRFGSFTLTEDCEIRFWFYTTDENPSFTDIQIELGSTSTDYEPYSGNLYPISWQSEAGTVYGGTLDVTTGVLTVDRGYLSNTFLSTDALYDNAGNGRFVLTAQNATLPSNTNTNFVNDKLIASALKTSSQANLESALDTAGIAQWWGNRIGFACGDTSISTASAFRTWIGKNGSDVVYPLATPITYHLTPTEVRTLLGQNNVWADTGDTEVTYKADVQRWVEKKLV